MNQYEMKKRVYQSDLKNRAVQVLLYLIDRSNKEGTCFPAIPTIGRELHISVSTVKRAMGELVAAGYVVKKSRFRENLGQTSNLYMIAIPTEVVKPQEVIFEIPAQETCERQQAKEEIKDQAGRKLEESAQIFIKNKVIHNGNHREYRANIKGCRFQQNSWTGVESNLIPP